jgi:hypothetical protein
MSKRARTAWVAAFSWWCSSPSEAAEPGGTPVSLVQAQVAAARRQDADGFLEGLTSSSRQALNEASARRAALGDAQRDFRAALDQRFGAGPAMLAEPLPDIRTALLRLAAAEVVGETKKPDGSVELRVHTSIKVGGKIFVRDEVMAARREDGAWKLVLGLTDGRVATQAIAVTRRMAERVRNGEFKDRLSAMIALDNGRAVKDAVSR